MLFWPGSIAMGPISKCIRVAPAASGRSATVALVSMGPESAGTESVVVDSVVVDSVVSRSVDAGSVVADSAVAGAVAATVVAALDTATGADDAGVAAPLSLAQAANVAPATASTTINPRTLRMGCSVGAGCRSALSLL